MYRTKDLFPYAKGLYMIFPANMGERKVGKGSIVEEKDYTIYFKPNTPEDVKRRFIKEYAEYHEKEKASGVYR